MRIGILINSLEVFGGIGKIAIEEVKALRALGVDAELLVFSDRGTKNRYAEISEGVPIVRLARRLPERWRIRRKIPLFTILEASHFLYPFLLPKRVKDKEWDLIVNHESYLAFALLRLKRKRGIRYVQFVWDPVSYIVRRVYRKGLLGFLNGPLYRVGLFLDRLFIRNAEAVLIGSRAHEEFVKATGKECLILYPAIHPQERIDGARENVAFMMTAWKNGKNPEYVFELLERMPELRIRMGGLWLDPEHECRFRRETEARGLADRLEILGGLSERALNEQLLKARVLLQTNDDRGFSVPPLEAAACGCPFVIPERQGVGELFAAGTDGFVTGEKDTAEIVAVLRKLMADPELAARMGRSAWEKARRNHSWQAHAEAILRLAERITA